MGGSMAACLYGPENLHPDHRQEAKREFKVTWAVEIWKPTSNHISPPPPSTPPLLAHISCVSQIPSLNNISHPSYCSISAPNLCRHLLITHKPFLLGKQGFLTADLHLSLWSPRPILESHPQLCNRTAVTTFHTIFTLLWIFISSSSCHPLTDLIHPQLQQASHEKPKVTSFREANGLPAYLLHSFYFPKSCPPVSSQHYSRISRVTSFHCPLSFQGD